MWTCACNILCETVEDKNVSLMTKRIFKVSLPSIESYKFINSMHDDFWTWRLWRLNDPEDHSTTNYCERRGTTSQSWASFHTCKWDFQQHDIWETAEFWGMDYGTKMFFFSTIQAICVVNTPLRCLAVYFSDRRNDTNLELPHKMDI